jgi:lipid II:glycine glycyltransferase (peptidoglycan interpeptide bridge formation enzyme)
MAYSFLEATNDRKGWDSFVLSSPSGHIFQTYSWGEISKELGWSVNRYYVKENDAIAAIAQILIRRKGPFSLMYIPRGPIFSQEKNHVFSYLVENLKRLTKEENGLCCKINPALESNAEIRKLFNDNLLRCAGFRDMHVCTYRLDLRKEVDVLWESFRGNVRTAIRKAEKSEIIVEHGDTKEEIDRFYKVYATLASKSGIAVHSLDFFYRVQEYLSPLGQMHVFNAFHKGNIVATEFLLLYGQKAEQMWAASLKLDIDLGASQLIHWKIIHWLKEREYRLYDLGGVPPDRSELPGIQFYKASFGGERVDLLGEYEIAGNPVLYWFWNKLGKTYLNRRK